MRRLLWQTSLLLALLSPMTLAQSRILTWEQVRDQFEASNPTLLADKLSVEESRAQQITAYLRPNPDLSLSLDGTQLTPVKGVWQPFAGTFESPGVSYLHERRHKRELRLQSAKTGTSIAESNHADLERTQLFNLRSAFVSTLQAKAVLQLAILRRSTSTASSCSASSTSPICRPPASTCGRPRSSCSPCSTTALPSSSSMSPAPSNSRTSSCPRTSCARSRSPLAPIYGPPSRPSRRPGPTTNWPWLTAPPIPPWPPGIPTTGRLTIPPPSIPWASASAFLCASSIGTRARSSVPGSTSRAPSACARLPKPRCSAMSTPASPRSTALFNFCARTKHATSSSRCVCAIPSSSRISTVAHPCSIS